MKILQVSNKVPFMAKDGGALAMHNLIDGLIAENNKLTILAMNTTKHFVEQKYIENEKNSSLDIHTVNINTSIKPVALILNLIFSSKPYNLIRFISKEFSTRLKDILTKEKFDIIQLEGLYVCMYIDTIKKYSSAKIAYRSHNIESEIWINNTIKSRNLFKRNYFHIVANRLRKFELSVINKYDLILPITVRDMQFFDNNGNNKPSTIIPFGVNLDNYAKKNSTDKNNLFYIGSLDWIPNIEGLRWFVQNVWKKIYIKYPDLKFFVAGRNASNSLISFLSENKVNYIGEIKNSKPFFMENTIMIVPLFAGSGMRVKIIEGMAYGKVIVTTKKGAEGIEYTNMKNIVIANDAGEFIDNIEELITNDYILQNIGNNARDLVEEYYNNSVICKRLVAFYKKHNHDT